MDAVRPTPLAARCDARGSLVALESNTDVPFAIQRVFYIYGASSDAVRGKHAHHHTQEMAICVSGSCRFTLDDGWVRQELTLDSRDRALVLAPLLWREMSDFSQDCVLLVLADRAYDSEDYIFDYAEFRRSVREKAPALCAPVDFQPELD